jgi:hypothetical protein
VSDRDKAYLVVATIYGMENTLIEFILRDWCQRVIADLDKKGIAPAPWQVRQAIGWVNGQLLKLSGEVAGGEEGE